MNLRQDKPSGFFKATGVSRTVLSTSSEDACRKEQVLLPLLALHPDTQVSPKCRMARSMGIYYSA
ncbi:hypothetical protein [Moorella sp. E306M]|uniref:hypothetical protein n=1 Tax=Moorella sp. E306M TaxID=2572683 RepID=UPI001144EC12|nr:hypothetical protein [Moorella sp. E306M]